MDRIANDLWALRLRVVDLDRAAINIAVVPPTDQPYETYYGPKAGNPVIANDLKGRVNLLTIKSKYLNENRNIFVYTPPGYDPAKRYPVVYMADGQLRGETPGMVEPLILKGELPPLILVAIWFGLPPDGSDVRRSQEYLMDWPDGLDAFLDHQDFLLKEVLPYVEQHYGASTDPKDRIITGFSSGAAWAIAMGLLHPDVFPNVVAQSLIWDGPARTGGSLSASMGAGMNSMSFSPEGGSTDVFRRLLEKSTVTRFHLSAGTLEPYFYKATMHFADEARETGHSVQFNTLVAGHSQVAWRQDLLDGLKWIFGPQH
jgi:enterochelin esterase family protein